MGGKHEGGGWMEGWPNEPLSFCLHPSINERQGPNLKLNIQSAKQI
jgi:hypothetical protein